MIMGMVHEGPIWPTDFYNPMQSKVKDEIAYPFQTSTSTVAPLKLEWISNILTRCLRYVISYPYMDQS